MMPIQPTQGQPPPWVLQYLQRAQAEQEMGNVESLARANLSKQLARGAFQFGGRGVRAGAEFVRPGALLAEDASRLPVPMSSGAAIRAAKGFAGIPTPLKPLAEGVAAPAAAAPSMLSKVAGTVGTAAGALSLGVAGYQVASDPKNALAPATLEGGARARNQQRALGLGEAAIGGASGAQLGATAGTLVLPGIGTAVGAVAGAVLGSLGGLKRLFGKKPSSGPRFQNWYGPPAR